MDTKLGLLLLAGLLGATPALAQGDTTSASTAATNIAIKVCNNTSYTTLIATDYLAVNYPDKNWWTNEGWYTVAPNDCKIVAYTGNTIFYLRAEEQGGTHYWAGEFGHCVVYPGPYNTQEDARSSECPSGSEPKEFFRVTTTFNSGVYTWTLTP
jgi:uncharacterized membrane protein